MNIHFKDKELLKQLQNNSICKLKVGSKMYGTDDKNSDTDFLSIYLDCNCSYYWGHHQLQFKGENIDYNFTELRGFIRNLLTGDATINMEVIFSNQLENTELEFLLDFKDDFINYNILRSYLGMARRDLKRYNSTNDFKKLAHSMRGYIFAYQLFYNKSLDVKMNTNIYFEDITDKELYIKIKNGFKIPKSYLEKRISDLRNEINLAFEKGNLRRKMEVKRLRELDDALKSFYKTKEIKSIEYGDIFYDVLENGLKYN